MFSKSEVLESLHANRCTQKGSVWTQADGSIFKIVRQGSGYNVKCLHSNSTIRECLRADFITWQRGRNAA